jgi:hypothetical protein
MNSVPHDFVTVDMRGLKAALVERARRQRVAVSVIVRDAVARALDVEATTEEVAKPPALRDDRTSQVVKLSLRMTRVEVDRLDAGARQARLSRTAFLVGLLDGVRILSSGGRADHLAALVASNENVSTLGRNINHLIRLLRESSVRAAQEYREMLETLNDDVRRHLALVSSVLAELRPGAVEPHARAALIAKEK